MADEFDQSKTEAPTQRRREESREQGQVAFSSELTAGLLLLTGLLALWLGADTLIKGLLTSLRMALLILAAPGEFSLERAQDFMMAMLRRGGEALGFFWALMFLVALAVGSA